jgi:hypothetical protein
VEKLGSGNIMGMMIPESDYGNSNEIKRLMYPFFAATQNCQSHLSAKTQG